MGDALIGRDILTLPILAASGALTANHFMGFDEAIGGDGTVVKGVVRDDVSSGKVGDVIVLGTAWVLTSENLAKGDPVCSDTGGTARKATTADVIAGVACNDSNSGEYNEILLSYGGIF